MGKITEAENMENMEIGGPKKATVGILKKCEHCKTVLVENFGKIEKFPKPKHSGF